MFAAVLEFLSGGISALFNALLSRLFGKDPKDQLIEEAKQNEVQAQKAEAIFAAPERGRADVDRILLQHANDK
jgi:hypothetical protein